MRFRVLGPLQTRGDDGDLVQLGAAKQRTLLAMLLLHANRPVGVDRLVDALWPDQQPPSVTSAVRTYVSTLRQTLGLGGHHPPRLVARGGGYLLQVDRTDLDLLVFEDLAARGQLALADGDLATAAEKLQVALALWHGRPMEDVALGADCDVLLAALQERRREVLDDCVEARLALGHHAQLATELRSVVLAEPLRERLWGQWMLALYRSGRQAEALAAYQELCGVLADQLGVEPGAPLRDLRRQIVDADPALAAPERPAAPARPAPAPRQVPPDVTGFVGRAGELAALSAVLRPADPAGPVPIAAVNGIGGVGKSALAVHVAHAVADRFPDGQLYADLQAGTVGLPPLAPTVVLARFLRALGVDDVPVGLDDAAARFRAATAGRRLLVVLDNAHDTVQVRPLIPTGGRSAVVVTSRQVLSTLDGATHLRLDVLSRREAVDLLGQLAGHDRVAGDRDSADRVAALCARLPLAVRIAGARLAARPTWPVRVMAERLSDATRRLDELEVAELGVRASFQAGHQILDASGDPLDRAAARAFGLLGLLDGPDLGLPVVARLLDAPEPAAESALERLVDSQLVASDAPGRYRMHDLVRLYAREQSAQRHTADERAAAVTRVLDWYTAMAWYTFRVLRPGDMRISRMDPRWAKPESALDIRTTAAAMAWLETERANLVAAVRQAARTPDVPPRIATQLAEALFAFFLIRGHHHEWSEVTRTALAVAGRTGDRVAEAHLRRDLGTVDERQGRYDAALEHLTSSLSAFEELDDAYGRATALHGLGVVHHRTGRYVPALPLYERSVAIRRELGDEYGQAVGLANLGMIHFAREDFAQALDSQRQALAIFERLGERSSQAVSLTALGEVYERLGRFAESLACHQRSLTISRADGNLLGKASALNNLGRLHRRLGEHGKALACHQQAASIHERMGERYELAEALRHLGTVRHELGQTPQARTAWWRALAIFEEIGVGAADELRALLEKTADPPSP